MKSLFTAILSLISIITIQDQQQGLSYISNALIDEKLARVSKKF